MRENSENHEPAATFYLRRPDQKVLCEAVVVGVVSVDGGGAHMAARSPSSSCFDYWHRLSFFLPSLARACPSSFPFFHSRFLLPRDVTCGARSSGDFFFSFGIPSLTQVFVHHCDVDSVVVVVLEEEALLVRVLVHRVRSDRPSAPSRYFRGSVVTSTNFVFVRSAAAATAAAAQEQFRERRGLEEARGGGNGGARAPSAGRRPRGCLLTIGGRIAPARVCSAVRPSVRPPNLSCPYVGRCVRDCY